MEIRKILLTVFACGLLTAGQLYAQGSGKDSRKSKSGGPTNPAGSAKTVKVLLFPDFYHYNMSKIGDTILGYECYDKDLHQIYMYNLKSSDEVDHIKYFKSYYQFARKAGSPVSPPLLSNLQYTYAHPSPDKWIRMEPETGAMMHYKLYKNKIVRTDSVTLTDPGTNKQRSFVYRYYKTEQGTTEEGHHH